MKKIFIVQHQLLVAMVILDSQLTQNQRLLCQECIENFESDQKDKTIGFKKLFRRLKKINRKSQITQKIQLQPILYQLNHYKFKSIIQNLRFFNNQINYLIIPKIGYQIQNKQDLNIQSIVSSKNQIQQSINKIIKMIKLIVNIKLKYLMKVRLQKSIINQSDSNHFNNINNYGIY
ncbi:unnamed protein product [Paramecium primaurelia]|uniref:Transmembrane protein n=1 Tax=Paramecium primaurelia TaxID=5886 RepID=A0A8S1N2L5_PARPR|nr:unnamed protein product [Paramecium primaurelia]